jgi:THO complex subunit 3
MATVPNTCCWNPEQAGRFAIAGEDKYVDIWDVRASRAAGKIATTASNINLCWSPDENYLAVNNKMDNLSVLDVRTMKQLKRTKAPYEVCIYTHYYYC